MYAVQGILWGTFSPENNISEYTHDYIEKKDYKPQSSVSNKI